jgi:hypothetical protein
VSSATTSLGAGVFVFCLGLGFGFDAFLMISLKTSLLESVRVPSDDESDDDGDDDTIRVWCVWLG